MLKRRGFDQEQTHLTAEDRVEKLIALLIFVACWAYRGGEERSGITVPNFIWPQPPLREGLTKPDYIGLTRVGEHNQPAFHDDKRHGDRIYSDQTLRDTLPAMVLRVRSYNY